MLARLRLFSAVALAAAAPIALAQKSMEFRGTIGQQKVAMTLDVEGDAIASGRYRYDSQPVDVPLAEGRFIGSTVILADDDGNVFHLHLKNADGTGTSSLGKAQILTGTMNRDDLELQVIVNRVEASQASKAK